MIFTDKIWLGAAAGAAAGAAFGNKDKDVGDRLTEGALLGTVAGVGSSAIYSLSKKSGRLSWGGLQMYGKSMTKRYNGLTKAGVGGTAAAFHSFGTRTVFTGLGAVIGASVAGEDHRAQGAAIGAVAGFGAHAVIRGAGVYKRWGKIPGGKTAFIASLSTLAFVAGAGMTNHDQVTAASYNPGAEGGYDVHDPSRAPDSGIKERIKNIGAHGDVVLGSHGSRHG